MKVLGIDPGLSATGFGLIDGDLKVLDYGVVKTRRGELSERLSEIYDAIDRLLETHHPSWAVLESVIYHKNVNSALLLGAARGVTLLALHRKKVRIAEFSPTAVKLAVTGNGRASKGQVAYMVRKILGIEESDLQDHITDALAVALTLVLKENDLLA